VLASVSGLVELCGVRTEACYDAITFVLIGKYMNVKGRASGVYANYNMSVAGSKIIRFLVCNMVSSLTRVAKTSRSPGQIALENIVASVLTEG